MIHAHGQTMHPKTIKNDENRRKLPFFDENSKKRRLLECVQDQPRCQKKAETRTVIYRRITTFSKLHTDAIERAWGQSGHYQRRTNKIKNRRFFSNFVENLRFSSISSFLMHGLSAFPDHPRSQETVLVTVSTSKTSLNILLMP